MKTTEEIIERISSPEVNDFFGAQKKILLCALPYEQAKPFLVPAYAEAYDKGELPEDEIWKDDFDPKDEVHKIIGLITKSMRMDDEVGVSVGFLYLRACAWIIDDGFYDTIEPYYNESLEDGGAELLELVSKHYGYKPTIETIEFEEIPNDEENS